MKIPQYYTSPRDAWLNTAPPPGYKHLNDTSEVNKGDFVLLGGDWTEVLAVDHTRNTIATEFCGFQRTGGLPTITAACRRTP